MASVQINAWEDGGMEGVFETVEEAEAYVLEEEMDVVVYDFSGNLLNASGYRFNTEIAAKRQAKTDGGHTHYIKED